MRSISGWERRNLDEVAHLDVEILAALTPKDFEFYYLDISAASECHLNFPPTKIQFREAPSRARKVVHSGDVLMSMVRPNLKSFVYFNHSDEPCIASTGFAVLRAKEHTCSRFILYSILSEDVSRQINGLVIGSNYPAINLTAVRSLKVSTPPKPEQSKIAEILATVDRAIEQTEALIAKQQRVKTGLMQDLLTRGIDADGNLRTEKTHEFKDSPLGRIPVEWEVCSLDSVANFVTSGSRGWARYYATEGSLFLRIGNLTRQHINMRLDDLVRVKPPELSEGNRTAVDTDDLLISITADLGIIAVIPEGFESAYVNQHIALVRLVKSEVAPRFVGWFLSSRSGQTQFEKLNESGAKAGLNLGTIKQLKIPKMEIAEQSRIAAILDDATQKSANFSQRLTKLRALKTALMQDLLTGRKRVTALLSNPPAPA